MTEDDPRHGTTAGYAAHRRNGTPICDPCRAANNRRPTKRPKTLYNLAGYDPNDGLTGGRWMRDTWGVVRWVQTDGGRDVA